MKRMKSFSFCLVFFAFGISIHLMSANASGSKSAAEERVVLQIEVFKVTGDVLGNMELLESDSEIDDLQLKRFRAATLDIAHHRLVANPPDWSWNENGEIPDDTWVSRIAAPRVTMPLGQKFKISASPDQGVEYFAKRPDGLFELKRVDSRTGVSFSAKASRGDTDLIHLRDFRVSLTVVDSRQEIQGIAMEVGRPILRTLDYKTELALVPGENQGLLVSTQGHGFLLIRIRADYN